MLRPIVLVVLAAFLAGCLGGSGAGSSAATAAPPAQPANVSDATGGIEGTVVDTEFRPIPRANVAIQGLDLQTQTDEAGAFALSHVPPGTHVVFAAALGAQSVGRPVQVTAGEVATVQFMLERLAVAEGHHFTLNENGIAGCFIAYRPPGGSNGNIYCGHAHQELGRNEHRIFWPAIKPMTGWSASVFEMKWKTNQVAGQGMQGKLYIAADGRACGAPDSLIFLEGTSPLRGQANESEVQSFLDSAKGQCPKECSPASCVLQTWVGTVPHLLGPSAATDAGLMVEQPFEQFHTVFFYEAPPPRFTVLPDA